MTKKSNAPETSDVAELSYEAARDELITVVQRLESGVDSLEESMVLWERGEALAKHCEAWLSNARQRLEDAKARTAAESTDA